MQATLSFGTPLALLLLVLVPPLLWLARGKLRAFSPRQRAAAFVLRGLLFGALILTLADPRLGRPDDRLSVVVAVDGSASIQQPQRELEQEWVRQIAGLARPDDRVTVLDFGRWAAPIGSGDLPPADATNLADALDLSESLLPPSGQRRVVLLTDGQQNLGRAQEAAQRLAARGIEVSFARPEPPVVLLDVLLRGLEVAPYQRQGETLQADALIESTHATTATIRLFLDDRPVLEQQVELRPGTQRVPLIARPEELGFHAVRAEIVAADDAVAANNTADGFTVVKPTGRVLVLESRAGEGAELNETLQATGLQSEVRPASAIPPSAAPLQVYESIVLVNVPSTALTLDQQTTLQSYVGDYGRGLFVVGGSTSFSLGAYANSPLGEVLPVDPTPPARRERGSVALFLVIDKSGSMEMYRQDTSKMAMAREAAQLAVEALGPDDQVGVVAFDSRFQWVVNPTRLRSAADVNAVKGAIAAIKADGGTTIFPALEAAYQAAAASQAKLKHVVLLTDGQSSDADYAGLIARMKPHNVTLTSIAVGGDSDTALLTKLAQLGDGRYYFTERPAEVPKIVTRETTIVSRNPIVEGLVRPLLAEPSPLLADLQGRELPALGGYVATGARARAHTILTSDRGDPLLAAWQYGLGRVVAWTSDGQSSWASEWLADPAARRVFGQAVRWAMPPPTDPAFQLSAGADDNRLTIRVQAYEPDGRFAERRDIRATVVTPRGQGLEVPLRQVGPGSYEVVAETPGSGAYAITAQEQRPGGGGRNEIGGFVVPTAAELRTVGVNRGLLEQIAESTGGRELFQPGDVFEREQGWRATSWTPLWPWVLLAALVLLPLDIAARRLSLFRR